MTADTSIPAGLEAAAAMRNAIDSVEEAYEFMLGYAAQGRKRETDEGGTSRIRDCLAAFATALDTMERTAPKVLDAPEAAGFARRFAEDVAVMRSVIAMLGARPSISSAMVDNTNALIAVRSFLTGLFFIDQVVLPPR
jgi:hypothetical protein